MRPMPEVLCRRYSKKQVVRAGGNELLSASRGSEVRLDITGCRPDAYLRSLQTADDVEGRVRVLVHLEGGGGRDSC